MQDAADDGGVPAQPQQEPIHDQGTDRADAEGVPGRAKGKGAVHLHSSFSCSLAAHVTIE